MALKPTLQISAQLDAKKSKDMIQQQLNKMGDKLTVTIGVDKSGKSEKQLKEYSKRISNIDEAHLSALKQEQKMMDDIHAKALKINREVNASLKSRDSVLKEEQKTRYAIQKSTDKQIDSEELVTAEIAKQRRELKLFQDEFSRKSTKLTTGQYDKYVDNDKLGALSTRVSSMSVDNVDDIKKFKMESKEVSSQFKDIALNAEQSRTGISKFGDEISHNASKFLQFYAVTGLVVAGLQSITNTVTGIYDLGNALNGIRIVTGQSTTEVNALAKEYNDLAKAYGSTTIEITKQAEELFRQGLNQNQVNERLKAMVVYSKISGVSLAESTEIITASANGTGESVEHIIDVFANLGDLTAAGADEIGKAMQRVAGSAETAGIPFEQLAGQISTVSSITRESASTIGSSFKSILARYGQIKEQGFNEEDETKINNVAIALKSIGVSATDSSGQLRPFGDVIDEVGGKFSTLDGNTQKYISTTLAGSYQSNRLLVLLNNYPTALKNVEIAYGSAGVAQQKFGIYTESNEFKLNKFKATMESLWVNAFNSDSLGKLLDFGTGVVSLIDKIGLLNSVIIGAVATIILSSAKIAKAILAIRDATIAMNIAMAFNPWVIGLGLVAGAIALVALNWDKASKKQKEYADSANKQTQQIVDNSNKEKESTEKLLSSIIDLTDAEKLSAEQKEKVLAVQNKLKEINPEILKYLDKEKTGVEQLIDAYNKYREATLMAQASALGTQSSGFMQKKVVLENELVELNKKIKNEQRTEGKNFGAGDYGKRDLIQKELKELAFKIEQNKAQEKVLKKLRDEKVTVDSVRTASGNGTVSGNKTTDDDKKTSTPSIIQDIDLQKERYASLTMALNSVNNELERNQSLQENTTELTALNKLREDEIAILKKKQIDVQNLTKEQQKERDELVKSLNAQGISFSGKGDSAKALNAEKTLNGLIEKMNALKGKSDKASTEMFAGLQSRYKTVKAEFDRFAQLQFTDIPKLELDYESLDGVINKVATSISTDLTEASEKATKAQEKATEDFVEEAQKMYKELWDYIGDQEEERMREYKKNAKKNLAQLDSDLDALEQRYDEANKKLEKDDINKKIMELTAERYQWSIEGSTDANRQIYEIDKELVDLNKQLAEKERRDIYDKEKKVLENKKEVINSELDLEEEKSQEKLRMYQEYANQKVFVEQNAMNSTVAMLATFDEQFKKDGDTKGQAWLSAFLAKVAMAGSYFSGYSGSSSGSSSTGSTQAGGGGTGGGNPTAGVTQYATGGVNTYTGLAKLDGTKSLPEVVLNPSQISNISSRLGLNGSPSQMAQQLYNTAKSGASNAIQGASVAINQTINAVINNGMDAVTLSKAVATETSRELVRNGVRL